MISTNQFKNGTHIEVDGTIFKVVEFQHVKPGKGGAFVRTKLKRVADGAVLDKTFRAGEKFRPVRTETRKMQFLYSDGSEAHFMDLESYDQLTVAETDPGVKGDTASGGGDKPATLESGVTVRVPLFVNPGDRVRVDTRSGEYVARA